MSRMNLHDYKDHEYFVDTVYKILQHIGWKEISKDKISDKAVRNEYQLDFHSCNSSRLNIGIWSTGYWPVDGTDKNGQPVVSTDCMYGYNDVEEYGNRGICLFLIHDWNYDKYRPSSSDWRYIITPETTDDTLYRNIEDINRYMKNPAFSYVDLCLYADEHVNMYVEYMKAYYKKVIKQKFIRLCSKTVDFAYKLYSLYIICRLKKHIKKWEYSPKVEIGFRSPERKLHVCLIDKTFQKPYDEYVLHHKLRNIGSDKFRVVPSYVETEDDEIDSLPFNCGMKFDDKPRENQTWEEFNNE